MSEKKQPTLGEVYDPLIKARTNQKKFDKILESIGKGILEHNPDRCPGLADGIRAATENARYYCQYFGNVIEAEVKKALGVSGVTVLLKLSLNQEIVKEKTGGR